MDIIGVIHLLPLPASPKGNQLSTVIERAVADARALESAGIRKAIVENFGDAPFYKNNVPPHVVSFMTRIIQAIKPSVLWIWVLMSFEMMLCRHWLLLQQQIVLSYVSMF